MAPGMCTGLTSPFLTTSANGALTDVELPHIAGDRLRVDPGDGSLVVTIQEWGRFGNSVGIQVLEEVPQTHDHLVALTHGLDLGLADTGADTLSRMDRQSTGPPI